MIVQLYSDCFDTRDALEKHVKSAGMKFAVGLDPGGETHKLYMRRPAFPVGYLIDVEGKVTREGPGIKAAETEAAIEKELERVKK